MSGQQALVLKDIMEELVEGVGNRDTSALRYFSEYAEIVTTSQEVGGNVHLLGRGGRVGALCDPAASRA